MTDALATVQNAYAAFGAGDIPKLLSMCSPTIRWQFCGDSKAPYTGTAVGHGQLGEWFGSVAAADDIRAFEPRRFLAGPGHVTVIGWERTVARASGAEFESDWVHVWTVEDGVITGFYGMLDSERSARARA